MNTKQDQYVANNLWQQHTPSSTPSRANDPTMKVLLIGRDNSGMGGLISRLTELKDIYDRNKDRPVPFGLELARINPPGSDSPINYQLWKIATNQKLAKSIPLHASDAQIGLLCIKATDIADQTQIDDLQRFTQNYPPNASRILVITGMDELPANQSLDLQAVAELQKKLGCHAHVMTSAKNGEFLVPASDQALARNGFLNYLAQKHQMIQQKQKHEQAAAKQGSIDPVILDWIKETNDFFKRIGDVNEKEKQYRSDLITHFFQRPYFAQLKKEVLDPLDAEIARLKKQRDFNNDEVVNEDQKLLKDKIDNLKKLRFDLKTIIVNHLYDVIMYDRNILDAAKSDNISEVATALPKLEQAFHAPKAPNGFKTSAQQRIQKTLDTPNFKNHRDPIRGVLMGMLKCLGAITVIPWFFSDYRKSMFINPFSTTSTRELKQMKSQVKELNEHVSAQPKKSGG